MGLKSVTSDPNPTEARRIMVVDDNESIRDFLHHFFSMEGLPAEIIGSPHRALDLFRSAPQEYTLLLTDCEMPGMTGLELACEVRKLRADLPMIIFSTSVTVLGERRFLNQGFMEALPKPVALTRLREAVRGAMVKNSSPSTEASTAKSSAAV